MSSCRVSLPDSNCSATFGHHTHHLISRIQIHSPVIIIIACKKISRATSFTCKIQKKTQDHKTLFDLLGEKASSPEAGPCATNKLASKLGVHECSKCFFVPIVPAPAAASCPARPSCRRILWKLARVGRRRPDSDGSGSARALSVSWRRRPAGSSMGFPGALPAHASATADGR